MKRLNLALPDDLIEGLQAMADKQEITRTEVLRKAIQREKFFDQKIKEGYGVQLVKDDSVIEVVFW